MTYIIDGYNLMHALGLTSPRSSPKKFREARERMLLWLDEAHPQPDDLLIVFDAQHATHRPSKTATTGRMQVRFSRGMLADDLIEDLIRESPRPQRLTIISNDTRIQESGRRRGCTVWPTTTFLDWLLREERPEVPRPPEPDKPDHVAPAEVDEWLHVFRDADDDDMLDRRGFSAPK